MLRCKLDSLFQIGSVPHIGYNIKNVDWKTKNASKEPSTAATIGIKKENETAPAGVISRCVMSIASCRIAAFFASGFIFNNFSLKLHNFSYKVMCLGKNSALNSWYSIVVGFEGCSSNLAPSSFSRCLL